MSIREVIYRMLIEGYSASQIMRQKKISKGYISKIINEFEKGGYIQCINPKSKPRFYIASKKPFTSKKFPGTLPDKYTRLSHRLDMVEIQKCSFICKVLVPPTKGIWTKKYEWHKGVWVQQYEHIFRDLGTIIFRRIYSINIDKLMIILPRICVHKSEVDYYESILKDYAVRAVVWIKKRFDMPLGEPVVCQKPHYAVGAKEPEMVKAIDSGSFNVNGIMADKSPPDFIAEIESEDPRDVVNYLDSIRKIKHIEQQLLYNAKLIQNILDKMEIVTANQGKLSTIISEITTIKKIDKPDTFLDVV